MNSDPKFMVFPAMNISYCPIPKVANTFFKNLLAKNFSIYPFDLNEAGVIPNVNKESWWQENGIFVDKDYSRQSYEEVKSLPSVYLNIILVRDPLQRMISAYREKVVSKRGSFPSFQKLGLGGVMDFNQFVDKVFSIPDHKIDIHLKSQFSIIGGIPNKQFSVLRVEKIDEWFPQLLQRMSDVSKVSVLPTDATGPLTKSNKKITFDISDESRSKIMHRYKDDYKIHQAVKNEAETIFFGADGR